MPFRILETHTVVYKRLFSIHVLAYHRFLGLALDSPEPLLDFCLEELPELEFDLSKTDEWGTMYTQEDNTLKMT